MSEREEEKNTFPTRERAFVCTLYVSLSRRCSTGCGDRPEDALTSDNPQFKYPIRSARERRLAKLIYSPAISGLAGILVVRFSLRT